MPNIDKIKINNVEYDIVEDTGWRNITLTDKVTVRSGSDDYIPQIRRIGKQVYMKGQINISNPEGLSPCPIMYVPEDCIPSNKDTHIMKMAGNDISYTSDLDPSCFVIWGTTSLNNVVLETTYLVD